MRGDLSTPEQILAQLADAPAQIAKLTEGLEPARLHCSAGDGEWSANDVLAHLRACADVWGGCIARLIAEDGSTIRAVSPRTWIRRTNYRELEFQSSLGAFTGQRVELLAVLEPLPPDGWSRVATVTGAGRVLVQSVLNYAERLARHERSHIDQIARAVNTPHS